MKVKIDSAPDPRQSAVKFIDLTKGSADFAEDVSRGLTREPKALSPRFFYDDLGSILFEAICRLDEYYVTRAEAEILREAGSAIVAALHGPISLVDLGCGSAGKTRHIIDNVLRRQPGLDYVPIDIDAGILRTTAETLSAEYRPLSVTAIAGSFDDALRALPAHLDAGTQALVLFLGSTIGNFEPEEQRNMLRSIRAALKSGDVVLLGADLVKTEDILIPAYDDVLGVTAAFNRNLLVRINRELGGTFDVSAFDHAVRYDAQRQRIEMHLVSKRRQIVTVATPELEIAFAEGESIHTESSYKFTRQNVEMLAREAGFRLTHQWTDDRRWFGEHLLIAT